MEIYSSPPASPTWGGRRLRSSAEGRCLTPPVGPGLRNATRKPQASVKMPQCQQLLVSSIVKLQEVRMAEVSHQLDLPEPGQNPEHGHSLLPLSSREGGVRRNMRKLSKSLRLRSFEEPFFPTSLLRRP